MTISRRRFLAAAAALAASSRLSLAQETMDGFLEIRAGLRTLHLLDDNGGNTPSWLFGEGPEPVVIRAAQGEELKLRFINDLDHEIWLHFFGVRGPSELMTVNVPPGADQAVDCVFTPPDAGTFWIGPMADQSRGRDMGLYALLVVAEKEAAADLAEQTVIVDDWKLDGSGAVAEGFGDIEAMVGEGRLGNWFTVNNRFRPTLKLDPARFTRLRILNAANVRTMNLLFKGHDPLLIARDGQSVRPAALDGKALSIAPGQRADLLLSPEEGPIRVALDLFEDIAELFYLEAAGPRQAAPEVAENFALPPNPVSAPAPADQARAVSLVIEGGLKGGLKSAKFQGQQRDLRTLLENGKGWAVNGVAGPSADPAFTATAGETLVLTVENRTAFTQPIHIQGHVWRTGDDPDLPWADTAVVLPGQSLWLTMVADNPGLWAIHSLVAERADGGLMAAFRVEPAEAEDAESPAP
jgi:FtsP/CotA-like multicopper oxidase with cupredoxin domain